MTLHHLAAQIHDLSVAGYFNGIKFSVPELERYLRCWFRPELHIRSWIMEIALPDGRWLMEVIRYSDKADGFDYSIPDTREQELRLKAKLAG